MKGRRELEKQIKRLRGFVFLYHGPISYVFCDSIIERKFEYVKGASFHKKG